MPPRRISVQVEEGTFNMGKLHGQGRKVSPEGWVEEGDFVEGFMHGKGKRSSGGENPEWVW